MYKQVTRYQELLKKLQRLGLDVVELSSLQKKQDVWKNIRGILPKKPTGLVFQRRERKAWV